MSAPSSNRLPTIGEFAAAMQLSPKALRLYDEQQLLQLGQAMPIYDALYAWRKKASRETHGWPQTQAGA